MRTRQDLDGECEDMDSKLFGKAVSKFLAGLLIVGLLLFIPAGTIAYWQAWLLIIILFVPMFIAGLILMKKNPDLLRKRLNVKEEQTEQKEVIVLSGLMFLAAFILAAGSGFHCGSGCFPAGLCPVRGGPSGKYLSFTDGGSTGKSESH